MYHKGFFVHNFHPLGGKQSFGSNVALLFKFFLCKTDACLVDGEKKYSQDYFYASIGK